jgi:deferrochelatase/peroxidase EfeB
MDHRLQQGLVFEHGTRPPPCYRLLLLNARPGAAPANVCEAVAHLVSMLVELAAGHVRELAGQPSDHAMASRQQFASLRVLLGYGRRFFDAGLHDPVLTRLPRPDHLTYLPERPAAFPALPWANAHTPNVGEADVAIQLLGEREAAVNCAAVECWKLIEDECLPLAVVSSFSGFGRPDGRGWLEFHDGVSNMEASQRIRALEARSDPRWMEGGTYMAFLRLTVDLDVWRNLDRAEQEVVVGRDKLSGAALVRVDRDEGGRRVPVAAAAPGAEATAEERADWRDPPQTTDPLVEVSHIHRANQNRASPAAAGGLRMFRQGYDFLDGFRDEAPVLGLNFVSFQSDLRAFHHVLHLPGWLRDVNFGGPVRLRQDDPPSPDLIALVAGGLYAIPPRAEPFPGGVLFDADL